ncbi:MAG: YceI family protein [Candidatus Peribacteraceae bacterium]|nr:YceI family protein [Candidatus Peribacteraceae bacterium]
MRKLSLPLLALSVLTLGACETSSLTPEQQAPVSESSTAFDGTFGGIDTAQSVISFTGKSNIVNHVGKFNKYTADVTLDAGEPANLELALIEAEIDMTSIEVDAAGLQGHLAKEDFFDTAKYPKATFMSDIITSKGNNQYEITGDLTIKDVTKPIVFTAEITNEYLTAHYDLPRADFGIGKDSYGEKLLEPTVPVDIKLVFQK